MTLLVATYVSHWHLTKNVRYTYMLIARSKHEHLNSKDLQSTFPLQVRLRILFMDGLAPAVTVQLRFFRICTASGPTFEGPVTVRLRSSYGLCFLEIPIRIRKSQLNFQASSGFEPRTEAQKPFMGNGSSGLKLPSAIILLRKNSSSSRSAESHAGAVS